MPSTTNCPSCKSPMAVHTLASLEGGALELDLCFHCQGLWFDPGENLKLAPAAVVELFRLLHEQRDAARHPLAVKLDCPRCERPLERGFDFVRSGRYVTYRCARRHGRFSAFSSFMIEKGFVRQLTKPEIDDIAQRLGVIYCTSCGAPVDLRKDHACPYCRAAFSLIDPQAVERALDGYATAAQRASAARPLDLADALIGIERDRSRAEREEKARRGSLFTAQPARTGDLWAAGLELVWTMLN